MNERDETLLRDMLDAARDAVAFTTGRDRAMLDDDRMFSFALVRAIEIVGEAAGRVSLETRDALPQIPWRNIVGMRNKIIHDYRYVDHDIVWDVATLNLPQLIDELESILPLADES